MSDPFTNFKRNLENDPDPNFLYYILTILEKTTMYPHSELLAEIRRRLAEMHGIPPKDVWSDHRS